MPSLIFRKGLDLKDAVAGVLAASYQSDLIAAIKGTDFRYQSGRLTIHLAREFGFCYGVDRAVDYAYQARERFPDRNVFLTGEIIHNPHVNEQLRSRGIRFLTDPGEQSSALGPSDVVILPAFGVTIGEMAHLDGQGCTMVDTTCGSVLNVWKNVKRYAEDGFTAVIHGKFWHEETRATASQTLKYPAGRYLIVLDAPRRISRATTFVTVAIAARSSAASRTPCRPASIQTAISPMSAWPIRRRCSARNRSRLGNSSAGPWRSGTALKGLPHGSGRSTLSAARRRIVRTP